MKTVQDIILEAQLSMEMVGIIALELGTINALSQLSRLQTLHLDTDFFKHAKFLGLLFIVFKHALLSNQISAHCVSAFSALYHVTFSLTQSFEYQGMGDVSMDKKSSLGGLLPCSHRNY